MGSRRENGPLDCKIYVGGLPETASRSELESIFSRYGRLRNVWVARRPPGFAFIEYEDPRDAEDASRALDGTRMCGNRVRVEMSHGRPRGRGPPMGSRYTTTWEERHGNTHNNNYERGGGGRGGRSRSRSPVAQKRYRSRSNSPYAMYPAGSNGGPPPNPLLMFDPSRPPPPMPVMLNGAMMGVDQGALSAQLMTNYIARLVSNAVVNAPPIGRFSAPNACQTRPSLGNLNASPVAPIYRRTINLCPSALPQQRLSTSISTNVGADITSSTTRNPSTSRPSNDQRMNDFRNRDTKKRNFENWNDGNQRPWNYRNIRPRTNGDGSNARNDRDRRKSSDESESDSSMKKRVNRRRATNADRIPASYRPKKPSNKNENENESHSSASTDDRTLEHDERVVTSNLDFDGVGSDVSDTEDEENPSGTIVGDETRWIQMAPASLYYRKDEKNKDTIRGTEKLRAVQDDFEEHVVRASRNARIGQPRLEPPPAKPFAHKCCHHHRSDSDRSESSRSESDSLTESTSGSEEGEIDSDTCDYDARSRRRKRKRVRNERRANRDRERERERGRRSVSSYEGDSSDSDDDDVEHERFRLAIEEMNRKQQHPARLHPELWFNEAGQMNDGPLCRCSWRARRSGIAHSIYPAEKEIESCDPMSNNLHKLHHYRVVIAPLENIKCRMATTIIHDDHSFRFDGFSIFSHEPLPSNLPVCRLNKWNIEYSITFSKEEAPELFTIRDLDLMWDYLFVELMEMYDLRLRPSDSTDTCPIFHVSPRFVRPLEEGGQEILPTCYVLRYFRTNYRLLMNDETKKTYASWTREQWDALMNETKDQIVTNPNKRPSALRVDCLDRMVDDDGKCQTSDDYPLIVHFGIRPAVLTYTGNPEYQKAWKHYVKFRHLLMLKSKFTFEDRARLAQKEMNLKRLKEKASLKRDVTVEVSSRGFYATGIYTDVIQQALMLLVSFCHVRFHWSLRSFENDRIKYTFKNRALLELAFTHPSYRQNYGTNPDHARNTLSNCGIRRPEYGDKRTQQMLSRKRGINTLIDIMSRMGSKKVKQSQVTNNERLEYLGDAVIEFLSTIHLFFMFPDLQEGGLATYRASLVQNKHLAILAKKLNMDDFMLYAHGPDLCHDADLRHAMANAFEAVMGALFLDGGVDVVDRVFGRALFDEQDDVRLNRTWFDLPKHPLQQQEPDGDRHWISEVAVLQKLAEFEDRTGIFFKHIRLLARAFTRKNVGYNFLTLGHNQRLEFLGDTVLQLVTSEYLYKHFPEHHEGHLSLLRSCLVNNKTQSVICDDLGMTKYVVHPPAFLKTGPPELRMKDKADLVEAFLGALYVDRGLQFCKVFCKVCFYPRLKYFIMSQKWNDPKSQLQQCCLTLRNPDGGEPDIPTYKVISVEGPTNTRSYKVAVYFKGQRLAAGMGHSVQEAEMKAAEEALRRRADLFPHLEKQRYFIENRFRRELTEPVDERERKRFRR